MMPVALATEDALSEAIALRLLAELNVPMGVPLKLRKGGFGYLKSRMDSWRQMAQHQLMFVLADLDRSTCVVQLVGDWLGPKIVPPGLVFRVAVTEVEAWALADHVAMRHLIGPRGVLAPEPDTLSDPKRYLLELAKRAPRAVREDLIAMKGAQASQGLGYNQRLTAWVNTHWSAERAAERSPSLRRARQRLQEAAMAWRDPAGLF